MRLSTPVGAVWGRVGDDGSNAVHSSGRRGAAQWLARARASSPRRFCSVFPGHAARYHEVHNLLSIFHKNLMVHFCLVKRRGVHFLLDVVHCATRWIEYSRQFS
ncbi:hypothetical protein VPH35_072429 [Triticum aestivum]